MYIFLLLVWDILPGFVLCDPSSPCHMDQRFVAQIAILEYKSIICAGYSAVLHIHSVIEEVQISVSLPENSVVLHVHVPQPQRLGVGGKSLLHSLLYDVMYMFTIRLDLSVTCISGYKISDPSLGYNIACY